MEKITKILMQSNQTHNNNVSRVEVAFLIQSLIISVVIDSCMFPYHGLKLRLGAT